MKDKLLESTLNGQAVDISTIDELLNNGSLSTYLGMSSLQADLFPTLPLKGPGGQFLNVQRKDVNDNTVFELLRGEVRLFESDPEKTGITKEALEDLIQQHGKENQVKVLNALFTGIINDKINDEVQTFLDNNSFQLNDLTLTPEILMNAERTVYQIVKQVGEIIQTQNETIFKSCKAYCLMPQTYAGQFEVLGLFGKVDTKNCGTKGYSNIIQESKNIAFVINPNPNIKDVYVGFRDLEEPNRSQAQYSPYKSDIRTQVSFESGEINYHIFNRYALTMNPVQDDSSQKTAMMWKFEIKTL